MRPWGYHLVLDLKGCDILAVRDGESIIRMLADLTDKIGMVPYGKPWMSHFAEHTPEAAGWTAVQLIETSSITAHFSDELLEAYIDIFSCKEFDQEIAMDTVAKHMLPEDIGWTFIKRGVGDESEKD